MSGSNLYASLSSLLAAAVAAAIGISVYLRDRERVQFSRFFAFCLSLCLFHLARFFAGLPSLPRSQWVADTLSLLLPLMADRFLSGFFPAAGPAPGRNPLQGPLLGVLLVLQVIALIFPQLADEPWWVVVDISITTYVVGGLFFAVMRMWRAARAAEGTAAGPRLRYLFYAALIALALGQPGIPVIGPIATAVYLYFMAQTLTRERLLDLPEILARIASMTLLVITVTAVYAALVLWVPWTFAGEPMLLVFNTLLASFAVLVLIDPLRTELDRRLESWLFHDRTILRALLDRLRRRLVNLIDPDEMVRVVMNTLRGSERVTRASLFLLDRQGSALRLRGTPARPRRRRASISRPGGPCSSACARAARSCATCSSGSASGPTTSSRPSWTSASTPLPRSAPASPCRSAASRASSSTADRRGCTCSASSSSTTSACSSRSRARRSSCSRASWPRRR
ncbi:hypothetical protein [Nannocystis pusilla]|uniref:hypothetical protein n=1 Tax=Nannocystis pusilla TaxID=889268 RepID=UPI003B82868D